MTKVAPQVQLRAALLEDALRAVTSRHATYGDPNTDFDRIARMWTVLFGRTFEPHEVAMALACLKLSRLVSAPRLQDSWTDLAGYAACGWHTVTAAEHGK